MSQNRLAFPSLAVFFLACALGWALAQGGLLFASKGLLASYDFPGHLHMSAVQMRFPTALWDDDWYAGYPTYAYPPLAHRLAGELMEYFGVERGFKIAVLVAFVAAVPAVFAAARVVAGLPPVPAAATALVVTVSPSLFRAFLFGQYPALVAYTLFLGSLTALVAAIHSTRRHLSLAILASLLVAALGSTHLYALVLMLIILVPLALSVNPRRLLSRVSLPLAVGGILAALPSLLFLMDMPLLSKTPVPHITRSGFMILPAGLLNWLLYPAGLPVIVGLLLIGPVLIGGRTWIWMGFGLVIGLVLYVIEELGLGWSALLFVSALGFWLVLRLIDARQDWRVRYLVLASLVSFWLALGPAAGLARLLPFSDVLVYDRPLLYGAPLAWLALARVLWRGSLLIPRKGMVLVVILLASSPLLGLSVIQVLRTYASLVPGANRSIPRGIPLQAEHTDFLKGQGVSGRVLPLGFPPIVYALPDVIGTPLIDGAYNDARVLAPFRRSGLEALGNEKFTYRDLRVTRFFLANADRYAIEWVLTADRFYDTVVPLDRFILVHEVQTNPPGGVRIYRSTATLGFAWVGDPRYRVSDAAQVSFHNTQWGTGGGTRQVDVVGEEVAVVVKFRGSAEIGWVFTEIMMPPVSGECNRLVFDAWSPTGAALTVRVHRDGRYTTILPEDSLDPHRSSIPLALDCRRPLRVQIGISGIGEQQVFLTPLRLQRVEDLTTWVPFGRLTAECFRTTIPRAETTVTVSVPFFPRWRVLEPGSGVLIGSDARGLLTLTGSPGPHTFCLSFPTGLRVARAYLPMIYLALSLVVGFLGWTLPAAGRPIAARLMLLSGLVTAVREVVLRHRLDAEQAWDFRARVAPDWYATFAKTREQSHEGGYADLSQILSGIDRDRLRYAVALDVGCGPGRLLEHMAPMVAVAYGVDISAEMIAVARGRLRTVNNVILAKNDGRTLSMFPNDTFDLVYSVNVFQHIPDRSWIDSYVREISRVLKSGGEAKIQADGRGESRLWRFAKSAVGSDSWAGTLFTRKELVDMAIRHGLLVIGCEYEHARDLRWRRQGLWLHVRKP